MILDEIVAYKRRRLEEQKRRVPLASLKERVATVEPARDFLVALRVPPGVSLIAEVKRASPSQGLLRTDFDPLALARAYERGGAVAISVLTDERFFQGSLEDLFRIRQGTSLPLLAKDFTLEAYQIYQARVHGADAILLIVAILDDESLARLFDLAHSLGMTALIEVHDEGELNRALALGPGLIGINNRNLRDFSLDLSLTLRLRPLIPPEVVVVSESGIDSRQDVERLQAAAVDAILVGEALMRAEDVEGKVRSLLGVGNDQG